MPSFGAWFCLRIQVDGKGTYVMWSNVKGVPGSVELSPLHFGTDQVHCHPLTDGDMFQNIVFILLHS